MKKPIDREMPCNECIHNGRDESCRHCHDFDKFEQMEFPKYQQNNKR